MDIFKAYHLHTRPQWMNYKGNHGVNYSSSDNLPINMLRNTENSLTERLNNGETDDNQSIAGYVSEGWSSSVSGNYGTSPPYLADWSNKTDSNPYLIKNHLKVNSLKDSNPSSLNAPIVIQHPSPDGWVRHNTLMSR